MCTAVDDMMRTVRWQTRTVCTCLSSCTIQTKQGHSSKRCHQCFRVPLSSKTSTGLHVTLGWTRLISVLWEDTQLSCFIRLTHVDAPEKQQFYHINFSDQLILLLFVQSTLDYVLINTSLKICLSTISVHSNYLEIIWLKFRSTDSKLSLRLWSLPVKVWLMLEKGCSYGKYIMVKVQ